MIGLDLTTKEAWRNESTTTQIRNEQKVNKIQQGIVTSGKSTGLGAKFFLLLMKCVFLNTWNSENGADICTNYFTELQRQKWDNSMQSIKIWKIQFRGYDNSL